jgi:hypothetical protein
MVTPYLNDASMLSLKYGKLHISARQAVEVGYITQQLTENVQTIDELNEPTETDA